MTRAFFSLCVAAAIGLILLAPVLVMEPTSRPARTADTAPDPVRTAIDDLAAWPFASRP